MGEKCEKHSAHEVLLEGFATEMDKVKLSVNKLYKAQGDMATDIALVVDKVDGMGHIAEAVLRLSIAVESGNADTKKALSDILTIVGNHDIDIQAIKNAPGKIAFEGVKKIFFWVMGVIGLILLGRFGLGGA